MVEGLFLAVPRGCLRFVIVVFPDYTHLLFFTIVNFRKVDIGNHLALVLNLGTCYPTHLYNIFNGSLVYVYGFLEIKHS